MIRNLRVLHVGNGGSQRPFGRLMREYRHWSLKSLRSVYERKLHESRRRPVEDGVSVSVGIIRLRVF